jgi:predicted NBD/HSP70 family sugar kinase
MVVNGEDIAPSEIRRRNLSRVLYELHLRGSFTRSELAVRLRINRSTVASLIGDLAARGLVWERSRDRQSVPPTPGRPSSVVELCHEGPAALAIELSTDWIRAAVIGLGASVAASTRKDLPLASSTPEWAVAEIHEMVLPMLRELAPGPRVAAIGVSAPGAVRAEDGYLHYAPNLGWRDVPLGNLVERKFADMQVPVFVGNDADLAASAEHLRGSGRGTADFICLWGEGGIGAGVVIGGRSLAGAAGYAGEVGHMAVEPEGAPCHCGSHGCWETQVGEEALLRRSGRDPSGGSEAVAELLEAADRGDTRALAAMAESGRWLGIGIAGLVNVFNPSRVSLGGLYARVYPYSRDDLVRELDSRAMPGPRAMVELTIASLGPDALLLGAAELALAPILNDPAIVPLSGDRSHAGIRRRTSPPSKGWSPRQPAQGGDHQGEFSGRFSLTPSDLPGAPQKHRVVGKQSTPREGGVPSWTPGSSQYP